MAEHSHLLCCKSMPSFIKPNGPALPGWDYLDSHCGAFIGAFGQLSRCARKCCASLRTALQRTATHNQRISAAFVPLGLRLHFHNERTIFTSPFWSICIARSKSSGLSTSLIPLYGFRALFLVDTFIVRAAGAHRTMAQSMRHVLGAVSTTG